MSWNLHQHLGLNKTTIAYDLPVSEEIRVDIYNIKGQRVRSLFDGHMSSGRKLFEFDGKSDDGGDLSSGIYLVNIRTREANHSRKMILSK